MVNISINLNPLDFQVEKYIIKNLNLSPPTSYAKMNQNELDELYNHITKKFSKTYFENFNKDIILSIILSIRGNLMRTHMIIYNKNITSNEINIINDYENGINIIELVTKYDSSPLNILRLIFKNKYKIKLSQIITYDNILNKRDKKQLDIAIKNDAYALINQDEILKKSGEFEEKIEKILNLLNIKYKTQNDLAVEQIKKNNNPINTPDFLILDNFYINGIKINWIDAKNFYGMNSKFTKKKIKSQTDKYINKWGIGAIIFSISFCSKLNFENILLIDYNSFVKYT